MDAPDAAATKVKTVLSVCQHPTKRACHRCGKMVYCCWNHSLPGSQLRVQHDKSCRKYNRQYIEFENGKWKSQISASRSIQAGELIYIDRPLIQFPEYLRFNNELHKIRKENVLIDIPGFILDMSSIDFVPECNKSLVVSEVEQFNLPMLCFGCHTSNMLGGIGNGKCKFCGVPMCTPSCGSREGGGGGTENYHEIECEIFQELDLFIPHLKMSPFTLHLDIATLRLIKMHEMDNSTNKWKWNSLFSHPRIYNFKGSRDYGVVFGGKQLEDVLPITTTYSKDKDFILKMSMVVLVMSDGYNCLKSRALYPFLSSLAHSCVPNVEFITSDKLATANPSSISLIATKFIPAGELLTVDFCSKPLTGRFERTGILRRKYIIGCQCALCLDPTDKGIFANALKCTNIACVRGYILPTTLSLPYFSKWTCNVCDEELSPDKVLDILRKAVGEGKSVNCLNKFEKFKETWLPKLHPNHYIICHVMRNVMVELEAQVFNGVSSIWMSVPDKIVGEFPRTNISMNFPHEKYKFMSDYCCTILRYLNLYCPGVNWKRGLILRQLFFMNYMLLLWDSKLAADRDPKTKADGFAIKIWSGISMLTESSQILMKFYSPTSDKYQLAKESLSMVKNLSTLLHYMTPAKVLKSPRTNVTVRTMRRMLFGVSRAVLAVNFIPPSQELHLMTHV